MEVDGPMDRVVIDLTGPHPTTGRQNRYILTCVDYFSRYLVATSIRNKYASTVAKALNWSLFCRWGLRRELLSNQGTEFDNKVLHELCAQFGIKKLRTSGCRPSANGRVERVHRTMNRILAKVIGDDHTSWDLSLIHI